MSFGRCNITIYTLHFVLITLLLASFRNNTAARFQEYIDLCNQEQDERYSVPCTVNLTQIAIDEESYVENFNFQRTLEPQLDDLDDYEDYELDDEDDEFEDLEDYDDFEDYDGEEFEELGRDESTTLASEL